MSRVNWALGQLAAVKNNHQIIVRLNLTHSVVRLCNAQVTVVGFLIYMIRSSVRETLEKQSLRTTVNVDREFFFIQNLYD